MSAKQRPPKIVFPSPIDGNPVLVRIDDIDAPSPEAVLSMRKRAGLSQKQAGYWVNRTGETWSLYERGQQPMPRDVFVLFTLLSKQGHLA